MANRDWRARSCNLKDLIKNLPPEVRDNFSDVTLVLDDGSEIRAHKLVLAAVSPKFEAQFSEPWANRNQDTFKVTEVEAETFRSMISFIYSSGDMEPCDESNSDHYWNLLEAANFFLVEGLIDFCEDALGKFCENIKTPEGHEEFINNAASLSIFSSLMEIGLDEFTTKLPQYVIEGYMFKIETLTQSAQEYIQNNEVLMETILPLTLFAKTTRLQIENFLEKNGTKEQTIERFREECLANFLHHMEHDSSAQLQYHFKRQSWEEMYENLFKDAFIFLNQVFGFNLLGNMSYAITNDVRNFLEVPGAIQQLIIWSISWRWYSCPLAWTLGGMVPQIDNRHCQHW